MTDMQYNPFSLAGKTILVTGASSGIGRAIAVECSRMGAAVAITARSEERLKETLSLMEPGDHKVIPADLCSDDDISALVSALPQLDGVVHNAGLSDRTVCKMIKRENVDKIMSANFAGAVLLQSQLLKKKKINKGGSVVFMASRAPHAPSMGNALYAASKGAIMGYAKVLGLELAPQKIRVNCICPGMVWTELIAKDAETTGTDFEQEQQKYPLKRYGKPEEIAYLAVYLLSDAAAWMTGSDISITGGGALMLA